RAILPAGPGLTGKARVERILQYLRENGEQFDADIAKALGMPLERVRTELKSLSAKGDVMTCHVTRFRGQGKIEGWSCRVAGFTPPISPGRKPGPTKSYRPRNVQGGNIPPCATCPRSGGFFTGGNDDCLQQRSEILDRGRGSREIPATIGLILGSTVR